MAAHSVALCCTCSGLHRTAQTSGSVCLYLHEVCCPLTKQALCLEHVINSLLRNPYLKSYAIPVGRDASGTLAESFHLPHVRRARHCYPPSPILAYTNRCHKRTRTKYYSVLASQIASCRNLAPPPTLCMLGRCDNSSCIYVRTCTRVSCCWRLPLP